MVANGFIDRLEVENFKSYRGKQTIGPFRQFQSIIGPNGAGKSNLMDAISFVLGINTAQLRGSNLSDLVWREEGAELKSNTKCSIRLIYVDKDHEDTTFERQINAKGGKNATSEYLIDSQPVKKEAYIDRLKEIGVLVKARNFLVFQGEVESIASKTPKELTAMIEQISGSEEFKEEYDRLADEKNQAEETTIYNYQKKKGITAEKKVYKTQKIEAENYQKLLQKKKDLETEHLLFQLHFIQQNLEKHSKERATKLTELTKAKSQVEAFEKSTKEVRKEQADNHKSFLTIDREVKKKAAELEKSRPQTIQLQEELERLDNKIQQSKKSLAKATEEHDRHATTVKDLKSQLKAIEGEKKELQKHEEDLNKQINFNGDQLAEYNSLKEKVYQSSAKQQQTLAQLNREQKQDEETRDNLERRRIEFEGKYKQAESVLAVLSTRRDGMKEFIETNRQKYEELKKRLSDLKETHTTNSTRQKEITEELATVTEELKEAKFELKQNERDLRFKETVESLKRLFPGVHGSLVDICRPTHARYNLAITVAMGNSMEAIVVDDEKTATECIQYLKEQRLGTATFLPLDKIKFKPVAEKYRTMGEHVKPVVDVIKFDSIYQRAVLYAVGNTLVCDTTDEARKLGFGRERCKVVTINGVLIQKSGLMTGGLSGVGKKSAKWDEKAIEERKKKRDNLLKDLTEIGRSLRSVDLEQQLESQVKAFESRLEYSKKDLDITLASMDVQKNERDSNRKTAEAAAKEAEKLEERIAARNEEIEEVSAKIHAEEDKIFKKFCKDVKVENIRIYEQSSLKEAQDLANRKVRLFAQASKLTQQIEYEDNRDLLGPKEKLEQSIDEDQKEQKKKNAEFKKLEEKASKINKEVEDLRKKQAEEKEKVDAKDSEIKKLRAQMNSLSNDVASLQRKVTAEESSMDQLRSKRSMVMNRVRLEEIPLPKKGQKGKKKPSEEEEAEGEEEDEEEEDPMEIEGGDSSSQYANDDNEARLIDYSSVAKKKVDNQRKYDEMNENVYAKPLQEMTIDLERLAPNMKAIEQFENVKSRLEDTNQEFEGARQNAKDLAERFVEIKQQRTQAFTEAFTKVSKNIDSIYKEITKNNGSRAYLTLENLDEPYLEGIKFNAIPPSKRFRDMEQLSGGEKTVAALALLFAIHSYRPSPFFVLDEVDAALDAQNVSNVAAYIKKRSDDLQCIVISLKDTFYEKADALVGIYKDLGSNSSSTLTLDLNNYAQ
eukprot:TRINITY_DN2388_c0_g1_i1.p1 TRINITY_DN2388_c0_g1~~TRINITY_DN2388_c0_g1_i1.p1  ORF type:complete len:1232 (-),score=660.40 TRINITY_DN2388_c0_g1_i1:54-3749(-)